MIALWGKRVVEALPIKRYWGSKTQKVLAAICIEPHASWDPGRMFVDQVTELRSHESLRTELLFCRTNFILCSRPGVAAITAPEELERQINVGTEYMFDSHMSSEDFGRRVFDIESLASAYSEVVRHWRELSHNELLLLRRGVKLLESFSEVVDTRSAMDLGLQAVRGHIARGVGLTPDSSYRSVVSRVLETAYFEKRKLDDVEFNLYATLTGHYLDLDYDHWPELDFTGLVNRDWAPPPASAHRTDAP